MSSDTCYISSICAFLDECGLRLILQYYENSEIAVKIKAVRHSEIINTSICSVCSGTNESNGIKYVQGKFHHSLGAKQQGTAVRPSNNNIHAHSNIARFVLP